jgi:hypothetical protein
VKFLPIVWGALLLLAGTQAVSAQNQIEQVFLQSDVDSVGSDRLTFINALTGEAASLTVNGERYTPLDRSVMYFDATANRVMLALPDGTTREHPFIQPGATTRRVDWLVSPDDQMIAWTLTDGSPTSLTTTTTVANLDGTNPRQVMVDGPRDSIRALPVAFSRDHHTLYMDFQPDGIGGFTPFPQYAGMFALDLASGQWNYLPDEPACFCGAGFGQGLFLRLKVNSDLTGFDLHIYNLAGQVSQTIPAQSIRNYTQAGDIVLSPDGTKAVYALSQVKDFGRPTQSVRTVFMLVDLESNTQAPLTDPITTFVEPIAWTEDDSAVIFTSRQRDGTWKVSLSDGKLTKVAEATYLGTIGS